MHLAWLVLFLLTSFDAVATPIDRVVLVVADQLVLESDLRLEAALCELDPSPSPFWSAARGTPEQRLLEAAIVRVVAADVSLYQPEESAVRQRVEAVLQQAPQRGGSREAFLARFGLTDSRGLGAVLRRRMLVERYLSRNLQATEGSWNAEYDLLIGKLKQRVRVRHIPEQQ